MLKIVEIINPSSSKQTRNLKCVVAKLPSFSCRQSGSANGPRLLEYYNAELAYMRELGQEFAEQHPKIATRFGMNGVEVADPYVERLLQGFMLQQIDKGYCGLSAWTIPPHCYTQAVADAAFEKDVIHLDAIPEHFVTKQMCVRFASKYPDMLEHIPLAMRRPLSANAQ